MLRIGQVESSSTDDGKYTDGNVAGGIAATRLRAAAFNAIQEELAHIVESTGVVLDIDDTTQVLSALNKIFAGNSDALGALAALTGAANKLPYFTSPKAAALADLTAFAREILAQTNADEVLSKLGAGNSATRNVGTTAGTVAAGDDPRIVNAITASSPAACTAWANFNGVSPVTIKDSMNVSSITRLSTGKYLVNFTNPMANTNYCPVLSFGDGATAGTGSAVISMDSSGVTGNPLKTTSNVTIYSRSTGGALDCAELNIIIFGGK